MRLQDISSRTMYARWGGQRLYGKPQPCFVIHAEVYVARRYGLYERRRFDRVVDVGGVQDIETTFHDIRIGEETRYEVAEDRMSTRYESKGVLCLVLRDVGLRDENDKPIWIEKPHGVKQQKTEPRWVIELVPQREIHEGDVWGMRAAIEERERQAAERKAAEEQQRKDDEAGRKRRLQALADLGIPVDPTAWGYGDEIWLDFAQVDAILARLEQAQVTV